MTKVIAVGITNWPAENTQLIGSTCADCSAVVFPVQQYCPKCSGPNLSETLLPRTGTLVAWTTQNFYPGPGYATTPADFVPFNMGLVQLDDVVRVEGRLTETDISKIEWGMKLELIMVPVATGDDGEPLLTFAFAPA